MEDLLNPVKEWFSEYPLVEDFAIFLGIVVLAFIAYIITKKIIVRSIRAFTRRTKTQYDDILLNEKLLKRVSYIAPLLVIRQFNHLIKDFEILTGRVIEALIAFLVLLIIGAVISSLNDIYEKMDKFKDRPIKGYTQVVKIIVYVLGGIAITGILIGQEPWALLTGLGALTAVIILIFRDTILSFVASIQISSYDLVRKGDWIEVRKFGADGDVIDISLNIVKVQNWDKTITSIPTYKLIEESFINWRGMRQTGGRRIKRSVSIDISTVKFLDDEMVNRFKKYQLIKEYLEKKEDEIKKYNKEHNVDRSELINGRRLTNLGTFRAYIVEYLKNREDINKNLTFIIRQLEPEPTGVPIQIYCFANTTAWAEYEGIQSDVFDHILSVVPLFDLKIFQNPTGSDFKQLAEK